VTPLVDRPDGVTIARLDVPADGEAWRAAFVGAYQAVWSEPPYDERHSPDEAAAVLRRALELSDNITLLAHRPSGVVVGFAMAFPVAAKYGVVRDIRGLLPIEHTMYFAELGVVEAWRGKGLGRQLVELRLGLVDRRRFSHVVLRTSAARNEAYEMYRALGFEDTGVYMEVAARRNDGSTRTDRRLFLALTLA
jgi:GNAT superfamily N-acetyltransferase